MPYNHHAPQNGTLATRLDQLMTSFEKQNNELSKHYGKKAESGRFAKTMKTIKAELQSITSADDNESKIKSKLTK